VVAVLVLLVQRLLRLKQGQAALELRLQLLGHQLLTLAVVAQVEQTVDQRVIELLEQVAAVVAVRVLLQLQELLALRILVGAVVVATQVQLLVLAVQAAQV
jgi:hypothetical protein